jgi:hypothetical protein
MGLLNNLKDSWNASDKTQFELEMDEQCNLKEPIDFGDNVLTFACHGVQFVRSLAAYLKNNPDKRVVTVTGIFNNNGNSTGNTHIMAYMVIVENK